MGINWASQCCKLTQIKQIQIQVVMVIVVVSVTVVGLVFFVPVPAQVVEDNC